MTSQKYPNTVFSYSLESESARLLHILNRLTAQEYRTRGFFFLPILPKIAQDRVVIIPDLAYNSIPNLWSRVRELTPTTPMIGPDDLLNHLQCLLAPIHDKNNYERSCQEIQASWRMVHKEFFDILYKIVPQYQNIISDINVILTTCGTTCTFSLVDAKFPKLTIYLRLDQGVPAIAEAIITALIRLRLQFELNYTWEEIESVVDFLLRDTALNQVIINPPIGTVAQLRKSQLGKLQDQSEKYLRSIIAPDFSLWQKNNQEIFYGDQKLSGLSKKNQLLLEVLLAKRGKTVSYDELADVLWQSCDNFSLWAIVKEISRLRATLVAQGLPSSLIQAHRKSGYVLS